MTLGLELAGRLTGTVVVVGVGNPLRGDDDAGCMLARRLRGAPGVTVFEAEEVPESFVGDIAAASPDSVVLVDAVDLGAEPGAISLLEKDQVARYSPTTHRLPLSLVMDVVQRRTGADVFLIGIQPADVAFGAALSPGVSASVELLAGLISQLPRPSSPDPAGTPGARPMRGGSP
ncbi:MAG TPA: hydrogenase 3 maturation endopeptidase HyCI [Thermoanaerobaculaceae bacterium]|nr:hydrogenase 3 maturation endopeptidase HyCI [Thermoanaerobaculaceae bacterium]